MKGTVIYTRYSSDQQRPESCTDQEREVRQSLHRLGIDAADALVIHDEAESGTKTQRDHFRRLTSMVERGEVGVLAVDDQARLTRADNAFNFITDVVYHGGRFLSTGEGIDTDQPGWELRVKVMELHHSQTIRDLRHRVRRGQIGRVLDDGSAGDFPYGYESYHLDADWAEQLKRRGPKPKKGLRVCEEEAKVVRQVFAWFLDGKSIAGIARELTRAGVAKGRRASTTGWHHQQVRRMLANPKYIGRWVWGATMTKRNSRGQKKQVAMPDNQRLLRERPDLRIIDQATWERAHERLAMLDDKFGVKEGQRTRGPKPNPSAVYPRSLLGGLLVCGRCGVKLWLRQSGPRRYYACPGHDKGLCDMGVQVPAERAEQALTGFLTDGLLGWPDWLRAVYRRTRELVQEAAARLPEQQQQDGKRLVEVRRRIDNLVIALADGSLTSEAVRDRLAELERESQRLQKQLDGYDSLRHSDAALPDDAWLTGELRRWAAALGEDTTQATAVLRQAVGPVTAHAVVAAGKRRGYAAAVPHSGVGTLRALLRDRLSDGWLAAADSCGGESNASPEFVVDLGEPTELDRWAPQIAAWRAEGVPWKEIVRRTALDLNRAYIAWKRFTQARSGGTGTS